MSSQRQAKAMRKAARLAVQVEVTPELNRRLSDVLAQVRSVADWVEQQPPWWAPWRLPKWRASRPSLGAVSDYDTAVWLVPREEIRPGHYVFICGGSPGQTPEGGMGGNGQYASGD